MTRLHNVLTRSILALSLLLMAACAGQMAVPQTPAQQAAYMEATLTGFYNTAATLRPHLTAAEYKKVLDGLDNAKIGLELAKVAVMSNANTSLEMLQSVQKVLNAMALELSKVQQGAK
jgi:hypothetical protein